MHYTSQIVNLIRSGQSGIFLTTVEPLRVITDLQSKYDGLRSDRQERVKQALAENKKVMPGDLIQEKILFWNLSQGLVDGHGNEVSTAKRNDDVSKSTAGSQFRSAQPQASQRTTPHQICEWLLDIVQTRLEQLRENIDGENLWDTAYNVMIGNADQFMTNGDRFDPLLTAHLQRIFAYGAIVNIAVILQTVPGVRVPVELAEYCEVVSHPLPDDETRRDDILASLEAPEGQKEMIVPDAIIRVTNGLSSTKTVQFCATSYSRNNRVLDPVDIFRQKAQYLGQNAQLDIWSPEFLPEIRLWPTPEADKEVSQSVEAFVTDERTSIHDLSIPDGYVKPHVRYLLPGGRAHKMTWLDPMSKDQFEALYRPERDYYSLKSIVGLNGIKDFLRNAMRPGVPDRARLRHVLMLGVPGVGKSMLHRCVSGEFGIPLTSIQASKLYSKWLGDTEKTLANMLRTVEQIRGILGIDEFQRFLPTTGQTSDVSNRICGAILTWLNDQTTNLVLSAANNVSQLPDEVTRSGRVDAVVFVGFPGRESKDAAWDLYRSRYCLPEQYLPNDQYWTPADIQSCCRLSEMQNQPLTEVARWITPSYKKNKEQMDQLLEWAERAGCICAETGTSFNAKESCNAAIKLDLKKLKPASTETEKPVRSLKRQIRMEEN